MEPIVIIASYTSASGREAKYRDGEISFLQRFTYEYFLVNVGPADPLRLEIVFNKSSIDVVNKGTAFRVYSCGIFDEDKIIIPLESMVVLPE